MTPKIIRRGDVHWTDLAAQGGQLRKTRPVLVVQNDIGNRVSSETIVVAIRDAHGGRSLPIFVHVKAGVGGLTKDSVIDAGHVVTLRSAQLDGPIGAMPPEVMARVDEALRLSLSL